MPIPLPNLDDRRWADLVEQGRALVPLYSPEWTDHNASDPGVTLMELFAWVAEMDLFHLNRISDRQKRRMLALLGIRPEPPKPARAFVQLRSKTGAASISLPTAVEFAGSNLAGDPVAFRSTGAVNVIDARLRAVQWRDAAGFHNVTPAVSRSEALPLFGDDPAPGAELYLGLDKGLPAGDWVRFAFCLAGEKAGWAERARILVEKNATKLPPHHSVRTQWEYFTGSNWVALEARDDTRSFTSTGGVELRATQSMTAQTLGSVAEPLNYIRVRFTGGGYDAPPVAERILLNGIEAIQAVEPWVSLSIAPGAVVTGSAAPGQTIGFDFKMEGPLISELTIDPAPAADPKFTLLAFTAPTALLNGTLMIAAMACGQGSGDPSQVVTLPKHPVVEGTVRLFSRENPAWRAWDRRDDFGASRRSDAHFQLDTTTGEFTFGDGEHGRTAPDGAVLFVTCDLTAAEQGQLGSGQITRMADSPHNRAILSDSAVLTDIAVTNPLPTEGGAAAETLAHAIGRAIELREAPLRAVTVPDFEAIALSTPGTNIARVTARPNLYPGLDCIAAPGVVTVLVVPAMPGPGPRPSAGLLAEVTARLERRRIIGTRVIVAGPGFLRVAVRAQVKAFPSVQKTRLRDDIISAVNAFFNPLKGGPDGTGWPFGRDVYRSEILQVLDEASGVDHVVSLDLLAEDCGPQCGNLCVPPTWLVAAGSHEIEVV